MRLARALLAAFATLFCATVVSAIVVGIDVGDEYFKVAMVRPGRGFEMVLNVHSNRKSATALSFHETTRTFGDAALPHVTKSPDKVITFPRALLGHNATDGEPPVGWPKEFYPYKFVVDKERGVAKVQVGEGKELFPEELYAHILLYIKKMSETHAGGAKIKDAVITIPCEASQRLRKAVVDAAEIAGLHVLALVHETSAAAIHHMLDVPANETNVVMFFNMGGRKVEVCVANETTLVVPDRGNKTKETPTLQILGCAAEEGLGGHLADISIAKHMVEVFQKKHPKKNIKTHSKALKKLERQAQKTKHVLSVNKVADFYVETLVEDTDFKAQISKADFEDILQETMFTRLSGPIEAALSRANLTMSDVTMVEVLGGGWRIPKVQDVLNNIIKPHGFGQHLNGDESMAMGAALIGANVSVSFRVKNIMFSEAATHAYRAVATSLEDDTKVIGEKEMIPLSGKFGASRKVLNLKSCEDFVLRLYEDDVLLQTTTVTKLAEACAKHEASGTPNVQAVFKIDSAGIIVLDKASAFFEEAPAPEATEAADAAEDSADASVNATDASNSTAKGKAKEKKEVKPKKTFVSLEVSTTLELPLPLTDAQKKDASKMLSDMEKVDKEFIDASKARNDLESYIYATRGSLSGNFVEKVSVEADRTEITEQLQKLEEWLYEDAFTLTPADLKKQVQEKLSDINKQVAPIMDRAKELELRPKATELVNLAKNTTTKQVELIKKNKPWVPANATELITNATSELLTWFKTVSSAQTNLKLTETPAFTHKEVTERVQRIVKLIEIVKKTPKPKPPPAPKNATANATANATTSSATTPVNGTSSSAAEEEARPEGYEAPQDKEGEQEQQADEEPVKEETKAKAEKGDDDVELGIDGNPVEPEGRDKEEL